MVLCVHPLVSYLCGSGEVGDNYDDHIGQRTYQYKRSSQPSCVQSSSQSFTVGEALETVLSQSLKSRQLDVARPTAAQKPTTTRIACLENLIAVILMIDEYSCVGGVLSASTRCPGEKESGVRGGGGGNISS